MRSVTNLIMPIERVSAYPRIIQEGQNSWRELAAEDNGLVVDARDYYFAFYKAARAARRSILMAGWQFDSGVKLLRGTDVAAARAQGQEVRLLRFLDGLCERRPDLHIYMLAWDFHMVFALEREWMQKLWFHWTTNERLHFMFDDSCVPGGCHHQKFVVIDGQLSFLGGIDICESRWDDRRHLMRNPVRISRGRTQKPYHDVQAYFTGPQMAGALTDLFQERWQRAGGDALVLAGASRGNREAVPPAGGAAVPPGRAGGAQPHGAAPAEQHPRDPQPVHRRHRPGRALHLHRDPVLQQPHRLPGAGRSDARCPAAQAGGRADPQPQGRGGEGGDRRGAAPGRGGRPPETGGGADRARAGGVLHRGRRQDAAVVAPAITARTSSRGAPTSIPS